MNLVLVTKMNFDNQSNIIEVALFYIVSNKYKWSTLLSQIRLHSSNPPPLFKGGAGNFLADTWRGGGAQNFYFKGGRVTDKRVNWK